MNKLQKILWNARSDISDPEKWTQKVSARDEHGEEIDIYSPDAVRWCAASAICMNCESTSSDMTNKHSDAYQAHYFLLRAAGKTPDPHNYGDDDNNWFYRYNDSHTHEEVMAAFDKAIELAGNSEQEKVSNNNTPNKEKLLEEMNVDREEDSSKLP